MAITVKALGLSVVIVFMLLKPSQSQNCHKTRQKDYGCPFKQLSSNQPWCEAAKYDNPLFAFYIKPGNDFNELMVRSTATDLFTGILDLGSHDLSVNKNLLPNADEWYHIQFQSAITGWLNEKMAYSLFINGHKKLEFEVLFAQAANLKFILLINGSPFYKPAGSCNPGDKGFLPPPPTIPPPPPTIPPPPPPPMSLAPPPLPKATTKTNIATPENDLPTTENSSIQPSFMRASKNSTDSETLRILGEPWWVFVIVGVAFMIIIAVIITAVIMIKKWKEKKENETGGDDEEKDTNKITTNNNDWQSQAPAHQFYESDDPANHIYEEPEEDNIEDHIYESVEDLGGPITFVNNNGGQSVPYSVAWQTRRGSSHDSENSIYGCL